METHIKTLEDIFARFLDKQEMNAPAQALEAMFEFYQTVQILSKIDTPTQDMLLFQYGVYDWNDTGDNFEFNITRQVKSPYPGDDEYYQFSLTLLYEPEEIKPIESFDTWSIDFPDLTAWKNHIISTPGYQKAAQYSPYSFRVDLDHT